MPVVRSQFDPLQPAPRPGQITSEEIRGAAYELGPLGAIERLYNRPRFERDPNFALGDYYNPANPLHERYRDEFARVGSLTEFRAKEREIKFLEQQRSIMDRGGWSGVAWMLGNELLSPANLIPTAGVAGGLFRSAARVGASVGATVAAEEVVQQRADPTRTAAESALNIGAATILGGILGGAVRYMSPRSIPEEIDRLRETREAVDQADGSVGAARAPGADLTSSGQVEGTGRFGRFLQRNVSPTLRLLDNQRRADYPMQSVAAVAEAFGFPGVYTSGTRMADEGSVLGLNIPQSRGGNLADQRFALEHAYSASVERAVGDAYAAMALKVKTPHNIGARMLSQLPGMKKAGAPTMKEFRETLLDALNKVDPTGNPNIDKAVGRIRKEVLDPIADFLIDAGVLKQEQVDSVREKFGVYYPFMYDHRRVVDDIVTDAQGNRISFTESVGRWAADQLAEQHKSRRIKALTQQTEANQLADDLELNPEDASKVEAEVRAELEGMSTGEWAQKQEGIRTKQEEIEKLESQIKGMGSEYDTLRNDVKRLKQEIRDTHLADPSINAGKARKAALKRRLSNLNLRFERVLGKRVQKLRRIASLEAEQVNSLSVLAKRLERLRQQWGKWTPQVRARERKKLADAFAKADGVYERGEERLRKLLNEVPELRTGEADEVVTRLQRQREEIFGDFLKQQESDFIRGDSGQALVFYRSGDKSGRFYTSSKEVAESYGRERGQGTVAVNIKPGKVKEIDAQGDNWINIGGTQLYEVEGPDGKFLGYRAKDADLSEFPAGSRITKVSSQKADDGKMTDELADAAFKEGYDTVIIRDVADRADGGVEKGTSTVVVVKSSEGRVVDAGQAPSKRGPKGEKMLRITTEEERRAVLDRIDSVLDEGEYKVTRGDDVDFVPLTPQLRSGLTNFGQMVERADISDLSNLAKRWDDLMALEMRQESRGERLSDIAARLEDFDLEDTEEAIAEIVWAMDAAKRKTASVVGKKSVRVEKLEKELRNNPKLNPELVPQYIKHYRDKAAKVDTDFKDWGKARLVDDPYAEAPNFMEAGRQFAREYARFITDDPVRVPDLGWTSGEGNFVLPRLEIPYEIRAPFLVRDPIISLRRYIRGVVPQGLMQKRFGQIGMNEMLDSKFGKFTEEYDQIVKTIQADETLDDATKSKKLQAAFTNWQEANKFTSYLVRQMRHQAGLPTDPDHWLARAGAFIMDWNVLRLMGNVVPSSIPDTFRAVMRYGAGDAFKSYRDAIANWKEAAKIGDQFGIGTDPIDQARIMAIADLADMPMNRTQFEELVHDAATSMGRVNLADFWNRFVKILLVPLVNARFFNALETVMTGTAKMKRGKALEILAEAGIDDDLAGRIWSQLQRQAEVHNGDPTAFIRNSNGTLIPNTEDWVDLDAKLVLSAYFNKEINTTIVTPNFTDAPMWMRNSPVARMIMQFRSFGMASTTRTLVAGMQQRDAAVLQGVIGMLGMGAFSYYAWAATYGPERLQEALEDPWEKVMDEAIIRSGLFAIVGDGLLLAQDIPGIGQYARFSQEGTERAQARFLEDNLLGPSLGSVQLVQRAISGMGSEDGPTAATTNAIRQMMFYQNVFYLRYLFSQVKNATDEQLDIPERRQ